MTVVVTAMYLFVDSWTLHPVKYFPYTFIISFMLLVRYWKKIFSKSEIDPKTE